MKISIFFLSLILFLISCETKAPKTKKDKPTKVDTQKPVYKPEITSGVVGLKIGNGEEKEELKIAYSYYELSKESLKYEEEINKYLASTITTGLEEQNNPTGNIQLSPSYFKSILRKFKTVYDNYDDELPWSYFDSTFIDESFEQFVQVMRYGYVFTGGAHGNAFNANNLFSRETGEQLNLKDFISSVPKLTKIAEKYFRETVEINPTDDLEEQGFWFTNGFELNENFYFQNNKMVFVYNQYEIGPYSMGIIVVEIPILKIKSLLKIDLKRTKKES